ncbi:MAG: class I SAM-dependent methyltransferase [Kiloniellaceae bacterium]
MADSSHLKFDASRAAEYARQARIGLAGYDACHELSACVLAAALPQGTAAKVLVVGAGGTGGEVIAAARLEPAWTFVAVDPSVPMLDFARAQIDAAHLSARVTFVDGDLSAVPPEAAFDAAIMIGVLHHIPDDAGKSALLRDAAMRLRPGASLIVAGNYRSYASEPLLLAAWANRWRLGGADESEVQEKLNKIMSGAAPPESEEKVASLLAEAGFETPKRFFSSLFWGAWHTRREGG